MHSNINNHMNTTSYNLYFISVHLTYLLSLILLVHLFHQVLTLYRFLIYYSSTFGEILSSLTLNAGSIQFSSKLHFIPNVSSGVVLQKMNLFIFASLYLQPDPTVWDVGDWLSVHTFYHHTTDLSSVTIYWSNTSI